MANLEFVPPAWLDEQSAEVIHERMMNNLPAGIDDTEAGFPWDFTKPTALEKAELLQFHVMEALKIMHYMFAYGIYLDYHAESYGMERKPAVKAAGYVQIIGSPGTVIPKGFEVAVPAVGDEAAITFVALEETTIEYDGIAVIQVEALEAGVKGNVAADSIVIMVSPISGIEKITNKEKLLGGCVAEDDESLRQRIEEYLKHANVSYVGCDYDYKRWAKEVPGVGDVYVLPEWAGPGTVKVVLKDANGQPANDQIVLAVYDHIISPDNRDKRKAPIGATLTVVAPSKKTIDISCNITFDDEVDVDVCIANVKESIERYFETVQNDRVIKRNRIGSIIIGTDGITDYSELTINGSTENIVVGKDEYPEIGVLSFSEVE